MAWNENIQVKALKANQDFSALNWQYRIVELATNEPNAADFAAGGSGYGVLMNTPRLGEAASVVDDGIVRCRAGTAIAIGARITAAASGAGGPGWATSVVSGMAGPVKVLGVARSAAASGSVFTLDMEQRHFIYPHSSGLIGTA